MSSTNKKSSDTRFDQEATRLAGGFGMAPAKQNAEALLRRSVMTCLLWEDNAYINGESIASNIATLIPQVTPETVSEIAVDARFKQKLRHVPLFICREMAKHKDHSKLVSSTLSQVINRPDELTEFLSLYWRDNGGRKTLCSQVKSGLSKAFSKFNEYQLQKYNRQKEVKLKDVLKLCHPKPKNQEQSDLWNRLLSDNLTTPDTWEVNMSKAKSNSDKRDIWTRLIDQNKLGASAFLKNLRNMIEVGVNQHIIRKGLSVMNTDMLLPLDFIKAAEFAPNYLRELENAMCKCLVQFPKLAGHTILVVDVSGSMYQLLSERSNFKRLDAAIAMSILASEMCESISIYATAGSDFSYCHKTEPIKPYRGFALQNEIIKARNTLGGGGIFTRQCLEYIKTKESSKPDRIIVFSDSQDCDAINKAPPQPFGHKNYIVDISSHKHGINYNGCWTAEISGWSEHFLRFIYQQEKNYN